MTELCRICFRTADISPDGCPCYGDGSAESELDCFRLGVKARDDKLAESETKLADAVRRELAEAEQYQQARVEELKAREKLAASERELDDVRELDELACRHGTRLDIPAKIPGYDPGDGSDHLHFVLMPIGARSRRAAVEYLATKLGLLDKAGG